MSPYVMTEEHEEHARHITDTISDLVYKKYKRGVLEHKSKLWELEEIDLLHEAMNEAIDQAVYIQTLIDKYEERTGQRL